MVGEQQYTSKPPQGSALGCPRSHASTTHLFNIWCFHASMDFKNLVSEIKFQSTELRSHPLPRHLKKIKHILLFVHNYMATWGYFAARSRPLALPCMWPSAPVEHILCSRFRNLMRAGVYHVKCSYQGDFGPLNPPPRAPRSRKALAIFTRFQLSPICCRLSTIGKRDLGSV